MARMSRTFSLFLPISLLMAVLPTLAASSLASGYTIPAGTNIVVELQTTLSTKNSKDGDFFEGEVVEPVFGHNLELLPPGSSVRGHVSFLKEPGRVKGRAQMRLAIDSITTTDGVTYDVAASLQSASASEDLKINSQEGTIEGQGKSKKRGAEEAGVGAAAGAGIGAIAGGGTGALYGAGIGAVAGIIHDLHSRHKDVILKPGTELTFAVARAVPGKKKSSSVFQLHDR